MASPAACGWCGKSANLDLVQRVCWFGLREQITRQRIEVVLSAHKVGAGLSAGEKNGQNGKTEGLLWKEKMARRSPRVNFSVSVVCTMKALSWLNVDIQNEGSDLSDKIS